MNSKALTPLATPHYNDTPHLRDYINLLLRRRWLILLPFVATVAIALYLILLTVPVYQASTTLRVQVRSQDERSTDLLGDAMGMRKAMGLDTELEILQSRIVAEAAVRRLHYQIQTPPSSNGLAALYRKAMALSPWLGEIPSLSPLRQPAFSLRGIEVGDIAAPEQYTLTVLPGGMFVVRSAEDKREIGEGKIGSPFLSERFAFLLESQELRAGDEVAFTVLPLWQAVAQFQDNIAGLVVRNTEIVKVSATAASPTLARDMAAAFAQEYIDFSLQQKTEDASRVLDFIERQLAATREQLQTNEGNLSRFKEEQSFVTLSSEAQANLERFGQFETSLKQLQSFLKEAEALRDRLQAKGTALDSRPIYALGNGLGSQILITLAGRLSSLQGTLNALSIQHTPKHPKALEVEQQIQGVQAEIMAEVSSLIANLRSRAAALKGSAREYQGQLKKLPQTELTLTNLTRQARTSEEIYAFLLKKREELRVLKASTIGSVRVIDPPLLPINPIKPQKKRSLLIAAGLGLMLGCGLALFVEYFDDSIKTIEEAEHWIGLPLLGVIPLISASGTKRQRNAAIALVSYRIAQSSVRSSAVAEEFRKLQTNIQLLDIGQERRKKLVITSPRIGDGKSTVAYNLALCLGLMGQKTLLVDADLRTSFLTSVFHLPRKSGLIEVLCNEVQWHEAVHTVGENVHLLTCGEPPPSPAELLASQRMQELLGEWEAAYDCVLFDVSPVIAFTDPVVVGSLCQGVLLVVRANVTSTRAVKRAQALLETARVPIVGMVLNGLKATRGYGYSYYRDAYHNSSYPIWSEDVRQRNRKRLKT